MGIADRHMEYQERQPNRRYSLGQAGNALMALFTINTVVFLLLILFRVFHLFTNFGAGPEALSYDASSWLTLPGNIDTVTSRPWTLLTFMFTHGGLPTFPLIILVISNMLWLWAFGYILQDMAGNQKLVPVYIYGGLSGALFFIVFVNLVPSLAASRSSIFLMGSGSSVTAIAMAVTILQPNYRMFPHLGAGIPVWVLTTIYLLVNLFTAYHSLEAHSVSILGGALAGFFFIFFLRMGHDGSLWMVKFYQWCAGLFNPSRRVQPPREKLFYMKGNRDPYTKKVNVSQQRIDEILDKINQKGYHFLSDEEKNILKKASEEDP